MFFGCSTFFSHSTYFTGCFLSLSGCIIRIQKVRNNIKKHLIFCESEVRKSMGIVAAIGILSPFPFYYWLWTQPKSWVDLCGKGRDPCKVMAYVAHFLKILQFISLLSVSSLHWPPPFYFWPLFAFGQFLNFRFVYLSYLSHSDFMLVSVCLFVFFFMILKLLMIGCIRLLCSVRIPEYVLYINQKWCTTEPRHHY